MPERRPKALLLLAVLLLAAGAALLLYPRWSAWRYARGVAALHDRFAAAPAPGAAGDVADPLEALYRELQRRNEELFATRQSRLTDPFAY